MVTMVTNKLLVWTFLGGLLIVNLNSNQFFLAFSSIFTFSVTGSDVVYVKHMRDEDYFIWFPW